jgi:hypothetical protein
MLAILEGDETHKVEIIKQNLHIQSERNARVLLHILETSPEKFTQKIDKEIHKLEDKLAKEYKKMYRKINSYASTGGISQHKLGELNYELAELQQLL